MANSGPLTRTTSPTSGSAPTLFDSPAEPQRLGVVVQVGPLLLLREVRHVLEDHVWTGTHLLEGVVGRHYDPVHPHSIACAVEGLWQVVAAGGRPHVPLHVVTGLLLVPTDLGRRLPKP